MALVAVLLYLTWTGFSPLKAIEQTVTAASYPYPECEEIVQYLKQHANDPGSVEIASWDGRKETTYEMLWRPKGGEQVRIIPNPTEEERRQGHTLVRIKVSFRSRNAFGAMMLQQLEFDFDDFGAPHPEQGNRAWRLCQVHAVWE
jgi:hypothetical protein